MNNRLSAEGRKLYYQERAKELDKKAKEAGALRRQEWWSLAYFKDPYLIEAPVFQLHKRYQDLAGNTFTLDQSGKITPVLDDDRETWMSRVTHVQEELFARGLSPVKADDEHHIPMPTFPECPPGLKLLQGKALPDRPYLVKIGECSHMRSMVERGEIRISPASTYNDPSLANAIKDDELHQTAIYSAMDARKTALGKKFIDPNVTHGQFEISQALGNFYVYCLTYKYHWRLPSDFKKDTVVVIKDPNRFFQKLIDAVKAIHPNFVPRLGPVQYYDPYYVEDWSSEYRGFLKHFRYAYQREFRFAWSAPEQHVFAPFIVNIGAMHDYADICSLV